MITAMKTCTNKGCGKQYAEEENAEDSCTFHPSGPVFHEGLKGYSCCSKRVLSFEEFLEIPGCTTGKHSDYVEPVPVKEVKKEQSTMDKSKVEVYNTTGTSIFKQAVQKAAKPMEPVKSEEKVEENDPDDAVIEVGTVCKRSGCGYSFKNAKVSRQDGSEAECQYHSGTPVFHEGSKGWSCCSRKVLEFEEFLKIKGCRMGKHLFIGSSEPTDIYAECRHDWYQSPSTVTISVYAKNVDPSTVKIEFEPDFLRIDFMLPSKQKFRMHTPLFQPIEPHKSKFKVMGTKVEIVIKKANGISWPSIEPTSDVKTWTTFGISGRTGTIGSKEMFIAEDSPLMVLKK